MYWILLNGIVFDDCSGRDGKTLGTTKWLLLWDWWSSTGEGNGCVYEKGRFVGSENNEAIAAGTATPSTTTHLIFYSLHFKISRLLFKHSTGVSQLSINDTRNLNEW